MIIVHWPNANMSHKHTHTHTYTLAICLLSLYSSYSLGVAQSCQFWSMFINQVNLYKKSASRFHDWTQLNAYFWLRVPCMLNIKSAPYPITRQFKDGSMSGIWIEVACFNKGNDLDWEGSILSTQKRCKAVKSSVEIIWTGMIGLSNSYRNTGILQSSSQ